MEGGGQTGFGTGQNKPHSEQVGVNSCAWLTHHCVFTHNIHVLTGRWGLAQTKLSGKQKKSQEHPAGKTSVASDHHGVYSTL